MGGGRVAPDLPPESAAPQAPPNRPGRGNRVAPAPDSSANASGGSTTRTQDARPPPARPVQTAWEPSPAEKKLEAHGEVFIPFRVAKAKVAEVQADMEQMQQHHLQIVNELEGHYKEIEEDLQQYFLDYIKKLNASESEKGKREKDILARVNAEATQYREMAEQALLEATQSNEELTERVAALEEELESQGNGVVVINEEHAAQIRQLTAQHDDAMSSLRTAHEAEVAELTSRLEATADDLSAQVSELETQNASLHAALSAEQSRNAANSGAVSEHVAILGAVVSVQLREASEMEADIAQWIEETAELKRQGDVLERDVRRLGEERAGLERERDEIRVSMEDGGRQMQEELQRIREELAAAEDRNRDLDQQISELRQEVDMLTGEKETAEEVGKRMAMAVERMGSEVAGEEERTKQALLRALEPLEEYTKALSALLIPAVASPPEPDLQQDQQEQTQPPDSNQETPPATEEMQAVPGEAHEGAQQLESAAAPETVGGETKETGDTTGGSEIEKEKETEKEGEGLGGQSEAGPAGEATQGASGQRQQDAQSGPSAVKRVRRSGEAAGSKLIRLQSIHAALQNEEARLNWRVESPVVVEETVTTAARPARQKAGPVQSEVERRMSVEEELPPEDEESEIPTTEVVPAEGEGEGEAEAEAEGEAGGDGKRVSREGGGEMAHGGGTAKAADGESAMEEESPEEEGGGGQEVGEGEAREGERARGEQGATAVGDGEATGGEEEVEGAGEEVEGAKTTTIRRVRADMVGDGTVQATGERIAAEMKRLCEVLLRCSTDLAKDAKETSVVQSQAAVSLEEIMEAVKASVGEVGAVGESLQEMEKGGAFSTPNIVQQQAANKVLLMARGEGTEAVGQQGKAAAEALTKNREKILEKKKQLQVAAQKLREQFQAIDENQEETGEMDEEERNEYVKIRKREFDLMEKRLKEKDEELTQHMEANKKMEIVLAASAEGQGLSAEEAQELIERHATELDDLREESGHRISKLQAEVSQLRETLDTDQEALQDTIDELKEQVDDNENKLIAAYDQIQQLSDQLKALEESSMETEEQLRRDLYAEREKFVKIDLEYKQQQAKEAEEAGQTAEKEMAFMQEQVRLAKAALKEVEARDKEEAAQGGAGGAGGVGKMKRSATAKNAFWELQKVEQDLDKRKEEVEEAKAALERLKEEEAFIAKSFEEKQEQAAAEAEREQRERLEKLEAQFQQRRDQLKAQEEEREALAQKKAEEAAVLAAIQAKSQDQAGDNILDQLKDEVRGGGGGGLGGGPQAANRAKAKAAAQKQQREKAMAAQSASGDAKKLKETEKKLRQMEANEKKLETKIQKLEDEIAKGGGGKAAGPGGKKAEMEQRKAAAAKEKLGEAAGKLGDLEKDHKKLTKEHERLEKEFAKAQEAAEKGAAHKKELDALQGEMSRLKAANVELEALYKKEMGLRKKYYNQIEDMKGKIRVYARCRPFAKYEKEKECKQCVNFLDDVTCKVDCGKKGIKEYTFDEVFRQDSKQDEIFEGVSYLVQSAVDGFNVCIFAYGQTGSGKTFTMYGKRDEQQLWGIAPRCMKELYEIIEREQETYEFKVTCYMLELYNDQLVDLLPDRDKKGNVIGTPPKLDIKLDARGVVQVQGAVVRGPCQSFEELYKWNEYGNDQRHVASTAMNAESSRSHLVFSVVVEAKNRQTGAATVGKLTLVDLAGSERQSKTNATGERLKEAKSINISLSALGNVISALSTGEKFVPYRDNLLTRLLQDGLGGNAKTLMFVNISPADYNADETASSLTYAARVKLITNDASKAQESAEVQRLKKVIAALKRGVDPETAEAEAAKDDGAQPTQPSQLPQLSEEGPEDDKSTEDVDDSRWMEGPDFEREEIANAEKEAGLVEESADD